MTSATDAPYFDAPPSGDSLPTFTGLAPETPVAVAHVPSREIAKLVVIDDEAVQLRLLEKQLRSPERCVVSCERPEQAWDVLVRERPDLILLDLAMPGVSGLDLLERIRGDEQLAEAPVLVLSGSRRSMKLRALELGAHDIVAKPVDPFELETRVRNALTIKRQRDLLTRRGATPAPDAPDAERVAELAWEQMHLVQCLARAAEFRDAETGMHVIRVGRYAGVIARGLGCDPTFCRRIEQAALLHDVGKVAIPESILSKPARLTDAEIDVVRRHCLYGARMIQPAAASYAQALDGRTGPSHSRLPPMLAMAARIALTHHERWDGTGYPRQLKGESIPLEGRITAVADVFDALSSSRAYKHAYSADECRKKLIADRGRHFDPRVLDAFLACHVEIEQIRVANRG